MTGPSCTYEIWKIARKLGWRDIERVVVPFDPEGMQEEEDAAIADRRIMVSHVELIVYEVV